MIQRSSLLGIDAAGATIALALAVAVYFGGVLPARSAAEAAAQERAELTAKQTDLARIQGSLTVVKQKLEQLRSDETSAALVARTPLDRISRISELAQASGVTLTEVTPGAEQPGRRYNQVPLTLRGAGRSPGFTALLQQIHREFPDTQVVTLSITSSPLLPLAEHRFEVGLVWYTVAKSASAGGTGSAAGAAPRTP